jgi:predicted ATPase
LLARLDKALDLAATGLRAEARQRTLRDTISWSYNLLTPTQQSLFRRIGVFAGGADLDAVTAVSADMLGDADPLDSVADLMDASLVTTTEGEFGEPRLGMMETIRAYAEDQLRTSRELREIRRRHAEYFLSLSGSYRCCPAEVISASTPGIDSSLNWTIIGRL